VDSKEYIADYFRERVIRFPDFYSRRPLLPIEQWIVEQIPPGSDVLDLCCGGGEVSLAMANRSITITGIDYVPEMIALATELFAKSLHHGWILSTGDATNLRLPDNNFTHVVCAGSSLNSMTNEDARLTMLEAARVLKPGGTVYHGIINPCHPRSWAAVAKGILQRAPMWGLYSQNGYGVKLGEDPLPRGLFYIIPPWKLRRYMRETGLWWRTKNFNIGLFGCRAAMTVLIGEKGR